MGISIECAPGEAEWQEIQIGQWLERNDDVIINLTNWSPGQLVNRFDLRLRFRSGEVGLYNYFPFAFKVSVNAPQAEIGEIDGSNQLTELFLEQVAPDWRGRLILAFMSEQSGVPKDLDLGPDERDLALRLDVVLVRQHQSTLASTAAVQDCADLDLDGQRTAVAPIFVVGSGRCGSSVLTWALGQHPNILPLDETGWLPMTLYGAMAGFRMASAPARHFPKEYGVGLDDFLQHIGKAFDHLHLAAGRSHAQVDFLQRLSGRAKSFDPSFQRIRTNWSPKQRWADGSPINTSVMPLLARAFPRAQFVAIIRDPRDVIASYTEFHSIGGPAYSIEESATTWLRAAWMVLWMRERLGPRRVMVVDYNEFARPAEFVRLILRFLGEPNCTSCVKPLQKRINSSNVSEEKRNAIDGQLVKDCAAVYAKICSGASWGSIDWTNDLIPADEEWLEDLINRLIHTVS
ncbi:MAG: sulfotransferase family protein [Steroidobacteraceae bacterium]